MYTLTKCTLLLCAAVAVSSYGLNDADLVFHLFTQSNPQQSQPLLATVNSIASSSFSLSRPTIITIHGHGQSVTGNFNAFVVPAHLSAHDVNLIAVDWSRGSSIYTLGLANAPLAGQIIANFVNILIDSFGYNINNLRFVGHGLGGHIAGIAARKINGEVPHIIALDPSFHGWTHNSEILNADDADVVEVLHATSGIIGYDYPLGDLDFYPNGGTHQNGCATDSSCAHTYAYAFYAESITREVNGGNEFVGTACERYEDAINLQCSGTRDVSFGGTQIKRGISGIYTFVTNFVPPFARG